jgi:hypothetical protein
MENRNLKFRGISICFATIGLLIASCSNSISDSKETTPSILFSKDNDTLLLGNPTTISSPILTPADFINSGYVLSWNSSDTAIVRIDGKGLCTPINVGSCFVYTTLSKQGNVKASDSIKVIVLRFKIPFSISEDDLAYYSSNISLSVGEKKSYSIRINNQYNNKKYVPKWSSSDTSIIAISPDSGIAVCKNFGKASVIVHLFDTTGILMGIDSLSYKVEWERVSDFKIEGVDPWEAVKLSIDIVDGTIYAVYGCSVYRSDDKGVTWVEKKLLDNSFACYDRSEVKISPKNHNEIAFIQFADVKYLNISMDKGETWTRQQVAVYDFDFGLMSSYMVGVQHGVDSVDYFEKGNINSVFNKVKSVSSKGNYPLKIYTSKKDSNVIYMTSSNRGFVSNDKGQSWTQINLQNNTTTPMIINYTSNSGSVFAVDLSLWSQGLSERIISSKDPGIVWEPISTPTSYPINYIATSSSGNIICYTTGYKQVFISKDNGNTWNEIWVYYTNWTSGEVGSIAIINESPLEFVVTEGARIWKYKECKI